MDESTFVVIVDQYANCKHICLEFIVKCLFIISWATVVREIVVVKKFSFSAMSTKLKHTRYFQHTYCIIERELNYCRVQKFFNMNILQTNIS